MKIPNLTRKGWSYAIGFVLISSLLVHLVYGDTLLGNAVNPSGRVAETAPQFPSKFHVRHVAISPLTHRFNIQADGAPNLGRIDEQFLNWGKSSVSSTPLAMRFSWRTSSPSLLARPSICLMAKGQKLGLFKNRSSNRSSRRLPFISS